MTSLRDDFVERARAVPLVEALDRVAPGHRERLRGRVELVGPCPVCGGDDRFSIHTRKGLFLCRRAGRAGDGLALAAYVLGLDPRMDFLWICEAVLGEHAPDGREETPAEREARERDAERRRAAAVEDARRKEAEEQQRRQAARERARAIWGRAVPIGTEVVTGDDLMLPRHRVRRYLIGRGIDPALVLHLRSAVLPYHQASGLAVPLVAMVAPIIDPHGGTRVDLIGVHRTFIDPVTGKKYVDPTAEPDKAPAKLSLGSVMGGYVPLVGSREATRWVVGEGIETTLAVAMAERAARPDRFAATAYAAAVSLGNLTGAAVPGDLDTPDMDRPAVPVPDHVSELVLLGDADSEPMRTARAMARAERRHARPGRRVVTAWPEDGQDFADMWTARAP